MFNITKLKLNTLFCLLIIITLCFSSGVGSYIISIPCIFIFFLILIYKRNLIYSILKKSIKKLKEVRWLVLFIISAFVGSIINIITGHVTFLRFLLSIVITYTFSFIIYYIVGMILPFVISNKKIAKIYIFIFICFSFYYRKNRWLCYFKNGITKNSIVFLRTQYLCMVFKLYYSVFLRNVCF